MKKIITVLCAAAVILGVSCTAFTAPAASVAASSAAQTGQEAPLYFSDKKIETTAHQYGQLTYEIPKTWKQEKPDSGVRFTDGTDSVSILVYSLEKALSGRKAAYTRLENAISSVLINHPAFPDAKVLSKEETSFLSSYAAAYEISLGQNSTEAAYRATAFTSPDLKSYVVVYMPVIDSASAKISSREYYEMLLHSMQWASAGTQEQPGASPKQKIQEQPAAQKDSGIREESPQSETVYWTSGGEVYHKTGSCVSLKRSKTIKEGSVGDAKQAGKSRPCKLCAR